MSDHGKIWIIVYVASAIYMKLMYSLLENLKQINNGIDPLDEKGSMIKENVCYIFVDIPILYEPGGVHRFVYIKIFVLNIEHFRLVCTGGSFVIFKHSTHCIEI